MISPCAPSTSVALGPGRSTSGLPRGLVPRLRRALRQWRIPEGDVTCSCQIIATWPTERPAPVHYRMPTILDERAESLRLDPHTDDAEPLIPLSGRFRPGTCRHARSPRPSTPRRATRLSAWNALTDQPPNRQKQKGRGIAPTLKSCRACPGS
ncbi:MAG: SOS response-associated peptidase family protein [Chloroflexota bacterium]